MNTENLLKLATYLLSGELKAEFNMSNFTEYLLVEDQEQATECGTVGCAAGHGPYAGIPKHSIETWMQYIYRVFDITDGAYNYNSRWVWLFSGTWADTDNTPQGAAKRILYLIRHGLPDDWEEQMARCAPLTYLNETL